MAVQSYKGMFFCDVDGTILPHGQKEVEERFFTLVDQALSAGFLFCISSGRFDQSLIPLFPNLEDKLVFSASNGCLVRYQGKTLLPTHIIDRSTANKITDSLLFWNVIPLVSTTTAIYLPHAAYDQQKAKNYLAKGYTKLFTDFSQIEGDVLQITAFCEINKEEVLEKARTAWEPKLHVVTTGKTLFDICPTNKGDSLVSIRSHFNIPKERTYAFGDDENDVSMLLAAGTGFIMSTAHQRVKIHGFLECNDIVATIEKFILQSKSSQ